MRILSRQINKVKERKKKIRKNKSILRKIDYHKSLERLRPDLVPLWSEDNLIIPSQITISSHKKVKWICQNCKSNFKMDISSVVRRKSVTCKNCRRKPVTEENIFSKNFPELLLEWNYDKNKNILPENVSYGSGDKFWWKCLKCGNEWVARMYDRTGQGKGCPKCKIKESNGMMIIEKYLKEKRIKYIKEKSYKDLRDKGNLRFDFYLNDYNILIEYNGKQHYEEVSFFGGKETLEKQRYRDELKRVFCAKNNIELIEIPYWNEREIVDILEKTLAK